MSVTLNVALNMMREVEAQAIYIICITTISLIAGEVVGNKISIFLQLEAIYVILTPTFHATISTAKQRPMVPKKTLKMMTMMMWNLTDSRVAGGITVTMKMALSLLF
jgi:hypothetical protein